MTGTRYDRELDQYRKLMEVPSTFEDGFRFTSLIGALFIAMLMVPGAIYMQLLAGVGVGRAAQWVTIILFIEVARRAQKTLTKPEIFVLFYMAGALVIQPMRGLHWRQFFVQSQASIGMGVAELIPSWYAPGDPEVLAQRTYFDPAWYPAIALMLFQMLMARINTTILSYGLFRLASDIEKLPFPMALIGAQGITALSEQQVEESQTDAAEQQGNWRWRIFSIGGILGLSFGALYMALPAVSGAILNEPIVIFPIPFVDWTKKTSDYLPAFATGMSLNLGQLVLGMVLPFFSMVGSFLGFVAMGVGCPILYHFGILYSWVPGDETIATRFKNNIDFFFSFGIGTAVAIALGGIWQTIRSVRRQVKIRKAQHQMRIEAEAELQIPEDRGDMKIRYVIMAYLFTSALYVLISGYLINWHRGVMFVLLFFAFLYTPLMAYVTARLEGIAGQVVQIPFIKQAAFILSGYRGGVDVWFLPVPFANFGRRTVFWRQAELTGTKFWSIWKAELFLVPILLISMVLFSQFIWSLAPIPSPQYPFAETMWELQAANACIMQTATLGRFSAFEQAFRFEYLFAGLGFGTLMFVIMGIFHLPMMLIYGMLRGLNMTLPHVIIPQFIGALIGRFYFERKMGLTWRKYIPVIAAGWACGMGLVTVLGVGANFLAKSIIKIPF